MKVKVVVSVSLKNIPDNYIIIDVPNDMGNKESYAASLVKEHLNNSDIAIKDSSHIIPKELIDNIEAKGYLLFDED